MIEEGTSTPEVQALGLGRHLCCRARLVGEAAQATRVLAHTRERVPGPTIGQHGVAVAISIIDDDPWLQSHTRVAGRAQRSAAQI